MGCGSSKVASVAHLSQQQQQHNTTNNNNVTKNDANKNVTSSKFLVETACDDNDENSVATIQLGSSNKLSLIDNVDNFAKRKRKLFSSVDIFEGVDKRSIHVSFKHLIFSFLLFRTVAGIYDDMMIIHNP